MQRELHEQMGATATVGASGIETKRRYGAMDDIASTLASRPSALCGSVRLFSLRPFLISSYSRWFQAGLRPPGPKAPVPLRSRRRPD